MRSSALSDPELIKTVNEFCVPLGLNITREGFPPELPGLKPLEMIYQTNWRFEFGFASCYMLDPEGKLLLGSSAIVFSAQERLDPEQFFSSKRYLRFIVDSLERWEKLKKIKQMPPLQKIQQLGEFIKEIRGEFGKSAQVMRHFQQTMML